MLHLLQVMQWCEMPTADMDCLVSKESAAQIHVVFMGQGLQPEALEQRRLKGDYVKIIAFRPTGECFSAYKWCMCHAHKHLAHMCHLNPLVGSQACNLSKINCLLGPRDKEVITELVD